MADRRDASGIEAAVERILALDVSISDVTVIIEQSAARGAARALGECGLVDKDARRDIRELRDFITAWRSARSVMWRSSIRWLTTLILALLLGLAASHLKHFTP